MSATNTTNAKREFMTPAEAAEWLGVTGRTIQNWTKARVLPSYRLGTGRGHPRYRREDVLAFLEAARARR